MGCIKVVITCGVCIAAISDITEKRKRWEEETVYSEEF